MNELIGEKIRTIRLNKGYSVEELAEKAGISSKHLYKIENAHSNFTVSVLLELAQALEVDFNEILVDNRE